MITVSIPLVISGPSSVLHLTRLCQDYPWVADNTACSLVATGFCSCTLQPVSDVEQTKVAANLNAKEQRFQARWCDFSMSDRVLVKEQLPSVFPMPRTPSKMQATNRLTDGISLTQLHSPSNDANRKCAELVLLVLFLLHLCFPARNIWPSYMGMLSDSWTCNWRQDNGYFADSIISNFQGLWFPTPTFPIPLYWKEIQLPSELLPNTTGTLKGSTIHSLAFKQVISRDMIWNWKWKLQWYCCELAPVFHICSYCSYGMEW